MEINNFYEQVWEYLLLISPPEGVKHTIGKIKKEVGIKYGSSHAMHSTAYISLVKFLLLKGYERNLLAKLFAFSINKLSIDIQLNNFNVFPRHTLYINVQENEELKKLQSELLTLLKSAVSVRNKYLKGDKKHHMTIARSLNPAQFEQIANEYQNRSLEMVFSAKNLVLLKRPFDEYYSKNCRWSGSHNFLMGC
jgi:2'-5' RNA ligase